MTFLNKFQLKGSIWPYILLALAAFLLGYWMNSGGGTMASGGDAHDHAAENQTWTCSMHPQIQQPNPGQCPICGMDLIPLAKDDGNKLGPRELKLSPAAAKLAEIRTTPVARKYVVTEIRMAGKVEIDETRLKYISAYVPGRIDRLFVDYTGTPVRKGDHLAEIYSPKLIAAQEELRQAKAALKKLNAASPGIRQSAKATVEAVREKLRLWGLTKAQISAVESRDAASDHLTIYSPISGIVVHRNATEGMYVETGTRIYTVADLAHLWVKLDAYESDLEWLRYGQEVAFTTEAYPGETFSGQIAFIDPVLDARSRTVKVRVNIKNPDGKLKPEMFVRAVVSSRLSVNGKVMDASLAGKWISPMHPEIIKDRAGNCDVCGMKLVRAETLGYVSANTATGEAPLVIPASAPLRTGKRAVVYVVNPDQENRFSGREITLGPRSGDYYVVYDGLSEGERVVTNGSFKLDSDLQIKAKSSMMNPQNDDQTSEHKHGQNAEEADHPPHDKPIADVPETFRKKIGELTEHYFQIQDGLSGDTLPQSTEAAAHFLQKLEKIDMKLLKGDAHNHWMTLQPILEKSSSEISKATEISPARKAYENLSETFYQTLKILGAESDGNIYRFFCPMAFNNKGAYWLQNREGVENPYFGAGMFRCGGQVESVKF